MLGLFMRKFKIPEAPLIITFLLALQAEEWSASGFF
jgi:TctA family transporter